MPPAPPLLRPPSGGFRFGSFPITAASHSLAPALPALGLDFAIVRRRADERWEEADPSESVWVLLRGSAVIEFDGRSM